MNTEFMIDINGIQTTIYMMIGFFDHQNMSFPIHRHPLVEMHILLNGTAVLQCNQDDIVLQEADVLCVPANMPHKYQSFTKDTRRISFFIDYGNTFDIPRKIAFRKELLLLLSKEIQEYVLTGKDGKLKALISYLCCAFFEADIPKPLIPITNRELLIEEFFSKKFNENVTLDDLAKELMLSHKQTEREVKRITGNTFVGELSKRKINAAIILSQTTNLSLTKISELVGFSSYSGFYKAYSRVIKKLSDTNQ